MNSLSFDGKLELRATDDAVTVTGNFAWNTQATDRPEQFAAMSMAPTGQVRMLYGHMPNSVLADEPSGTLEVRQEAEGLGFTATLPPEPSMTTWQRDAISALRQGLIGGVSPGFRVTDEEYRAGVRIIKSANLFELSLVPRPAYNAPVAVREEAEELVEKVHHA